MDLIWNKELRKWMKQEDASEFIIEGLKSLEFASLAESIFGKQIHSPMLSHKKLWEMLEENEYDSPYLSGSE